MSAPAFSVAYDMSLERGVIHDMFAYRMWRNPSTNSIHGILMLNPGSNGDGRVAVDGRRSYSGE